MTGSRLILAILAMLLASFVSSQNVRCGISWSEANRSCGLSCLKDADCPAGTFCFKQLDSTICTGLVTTESFPSQTAGSTSSTDVVSELSSSVSTSLPKTRMSPTTSFLADITTSVFSVFPSIDVTTTSVKPSAASTLASTSSSFTSSTSILSASFSQPSPASSLATSSLAIAPTAADAIAKGGYIPWSNAVFIIALTGVLVAVAACITMLVCWHHKRGMPQLARPHDY
ncbi:hypothetical protein BC830DRAFT_1148235 [Chytriomyces sp. MP71]|nr:hypothetical protein BC830DRAFT_1148235 [Chytriomyces sp. MP71]